MPRMFTRDPLWFLARLRDDEAELLTWLWRLAGEKVPEEERLVQPEMHGTAAIEDGLGLGFVFPPDPVASPEAWVCCFVALISEDGASVRRSFSFVLEAAGEAIDEGPGRICRWDGPIHTSYGDALPNPADMRDAVWHLVEAIEAGREDDEWVTRTNKSERPQRVEVNPVFAHKVPNLVTEDAGRWYLR